MANAEKIRMLTQEVSILASRLKPAGTEYMPNEIRAKTKVNLDTLAAIDVINGRIAELKLEAAEEMSVSEQMQEELEPLPKSYDYEEEQARLRRIQDSAAGRKPNEVRDAYLWSANKEGHWSPVKDEPVNRKAVTQDEMRKFYNNGPHIGARENDDGTWDMSAAARMATDDDVKHTKEYYTDKDRNRAVETIRPMEGEDLPSRDPLPVNTFK